MVVLVHGSTVKGEPWEYTCLSTDTLPTTINDAGDPVPTNSIALELDTNVFDYFDGSSWQVVGGNA